MSKTFSVKWLEGKIVVVEVDGVQYNRIGQIPDEKDRARLRGLMACAGQQVKIGYNPARPLDARVQSSSGTLARWTLPIIPAVLGVCFGLAAAFAHWMAKTTSEFASPDRMAW